jgi:hypothetical protein
LDVDIGGFVRVVSANVDKFDAGDHQAACHMLLGVARFRGVTIESYADVIVDCFHMLTESAMAHSSREVLCELAHTLVAIHAPLWVDLCRAGVVSWLVAEASELTSGQKMVEVLLRTFVNAGVRVSFEEVWPYVVELRHLLEWAGDESVVGEKALLLIALSAHFEFGARGRAERVVVSRLEEGDFVDQFLLGLEDRPFEWRAAAVGLSTILVKDASSGVVRRLVDVGVLDAALATISGSDDAIVLQRGLALMEGFATRVSYERSVRPGRGFDDLVWPEEALRLADSLRDDPHEHVAAEAERAHHALMGVVMA